MRAFRLVTLVVLAGMTILIGSALLHSARGGEAIERQRSTADPNLAEHDAKYLAVGEDAAAAKTAIARLRAMGPRGLKVLMDANADLIARHSLAPAKSDAGDATEWGRVSSAIDAVAAQKDAYTSGLYWYTDLDAAKRAARGSGKPILSLRLLGTLDSEYSCANSRYFRTVLYANKDVSKALAENFVLHWKSVRPVPKITIDFGDGRVVERTITGNSIHYVLDAEGNVIDGIPGLYGPKAFLRQVLGAQVMARQTATMGPSQRTAALRGWHVSQIKRDLADWQSDLQQAGVGPVYTPIVYSGKLTLMSNEAPQPMLAQPGFAQPAPPTARTAAPLAASKCSVEMPMVQAMAPSAEPWTGPVTGQFIQLSGVGQADGRTVLSVGLAGQPTAPPDAALLEAASTEAAWSKIATLHADDARLDAGSKALMAAKNPSAVNAGRLAVSKAKVESPMIRLVRNFERSIAEDTVRNEYTFHRQIHQWLADGATADGKPLAGVDPLNDQVYAQLFLTPSSDPWLGLVPPDTYTALPDEGLCKK